MIELKVKAQQDIVMDKKRQFMSSRMPMVKSMQIGTDGIICFTGFGEDLNDLTISKECKDVYGNVESVLFAHHVSWNERTKSVYGDL